MDHASTDIPPSPLTWAYADAWAEEDPEVAAARRTAASMGTAALSRPAGSLLRLVAASLGARAVVEVGSGTGVSGGWILGGLDDAATLTTVDPDPELAAAARATFTRMRIPHTRVRAIAGNPFDVLTRLTDGAYDLLVIGPGISLGVGEEHDLLRQASRLLRPGGAIAITHALSDDGVEPTHRDLLQHLRDDPDWTASLLTVGEGVAVAVRRVPDVEDSGDI
ncbi:MAG: hypothetical protein B7C55_07490 [Actinomycetales bacterium mxb001]|nr:MAG: hypothetical protein B7C55_07490 [Actinomycetales bacterium mxb001]